ncbi:hypothetical protein, partial [Desulfobacula sp.]|uniref:hypothetical protein n=1 Tax=Desulfobacula sp. TaxID=2593537 RepID=UPI002622475E
QRNTRHTTHLDGFPSKVTITKNLHPLQGKSLDILGWLHRNEILHLTLVLPDGTRSYIPAAWTNLCELSPQKFKSSGNPATNNLIASTSNLLQARKIVDVLLEKIYPLEQKPETALKEGHNRAKANGILARSGGTATKSSNLGKSQSSTERKNYNRSIPSCQQVRLPGEYKSNQGGK